MIVVTVSYQSNPAFVGDVFGFVVVPSQKAANSVSRFFSEKIGALTKLSELQSENERLKAENESLLYANSRLRAVDEENKKLAEALNIKLRYIDYPTIGAHITGKDPGNWYKVFMIDIGENDGVFKDMVVIATGGLVGRVVEAGAKYAKVVSLIDDTSSVAAMTARTESTGIVRGDLNLMMENLCKMELIDADAPVAIGDEVVTSHLSSLYPPGITIGKIVDIRPDANGTKYALVQPVVDFSKMEIVLIIDKRFERQFPEDALEGVIKEN